MGWSFPIAAARTDPCRARTTGRASRPWSAVLVALLVGRARPVGALTLACAVGLVGASALAGQERRLEIERFDSVIEVSEDGSMEVRESLRVRFVGSWNGIFRRIPVRFETPSGFGYKLLLKVTGVTSESGQPLEYWEDADGAYRQVKIAVPGAHDAVRTVRISYEVANGLRFFEEHDELYWNVTGTEWPVAIGAASARVELPDGVSGVRSTAYTGHYGSSAQDVTVQDLGSEVYFEADRPLEFREGLTVVVGWDPGVVSRPGTLTLAWRFLRSNVLLLIPFLSFIGFYRAWRTRGRDPKTGPITTQYEPPDGLRPAELGTLIDGRPDMHDLTATLIDMAVRGYIRLEETEKTGFLKFGKEVTIHRVAERESWNALHRHERKTLQGIFQAHLDQVDLSDLKAEYYSHLSGIRDGIWDHLLELGFYDERPDKVMAKWIGLALLSGGVVLAGSLLMASRLFLSPLTAVLAAVGTLVPGIIFAVIMPARTKAGVRALERVLGFEEFLKRVDADRIRRMNLAPETFERLLPYAMALKVEEKWAKAFEGIYTEPPQWYSGTSHHSGRFTPRLFVSDLGGLSHRVGSTMASTPARSSGSSGFSSGGGGGGFSGGGFGGGGGGGW